MQPQSLPKFLLTVFAFVTMIATSRAQTINIVPEPGPKYEYAYHDPSAPWGFAGNPVVYKNQLYVQYQAVPPSVLAFSGTVPIQLAQYSGDTLKLIANPDTALTGEASGYVYEASGYVYGSTPIVYKDKLCINYIDKNNVHRLATYDGTTLSLLPDISDVFRDYGYQDDPIVYNDKLYIRYTFALGGISSLAQFDGTTLTLIPNPFSSSIQYGYQGNPIVFNGKLYVRYYDVSVNASQLAAFDGTAWTQIPNPDTSTNGYQGDPIIFKDKLYMRYATASNAFQLMVYDGTNPPSLIANPDSSQSGQGYAGFPIIYNNNLYIRYVNANNVPQLAICNGNSVRLMSNPTQASIFEGYLGNPIVFNNTLCMFYRSYSKINQLAVYNGGDTLHLVPDSNANMYSRIYFGPWNWPVVYGTNLYFQYIYYDVAGPRFKLGYFDGTSLKFVPNPPSIASGSLSSYSGFPIVFNNLLYMQFADVQYHDFRNLAWFDQATLPVTWLSFNGVLRNNAALLNWSTATEINNKGFEVQRSNNGESFTDIGFLTGQGNSTIVHNYEYADSKVSTGSNYYRLKQNDFDGKFKYSSVIRLDYSKFAWEIFGNPVSNNSWMQLQLDKTSNVSVQIISTAGNVIQTINKGIISAGTYSIPLNLSTTSSGMYVVRLVVNNKAYTKKIVK